MGVSVFGLLLRESLSRLSRSQKFIWPSDGWLGADNQPSLPPPLPYTAQITMPDQMEMQLKYQVQTGLEPSRVWPD